MRTLRYILLLLVTGVFNSQVKAQELSTLEPEHLEDLVIDRDVRTYVAKLDIGSKVVWATVMFNNGRLYVPFMTQERDTVLNFGTYRSDIRHQKWVKNFEASFNGRADVQRLTATRYGKEIFPMFLHYGDSEVMCSVKPRSKSDWVSGVAVSQSLGNGFDVVGVLSNLRYSCTIFNAKDNKGYNHIFKVRGEPDGLKWYDAELAVRHNHKELTAMSLATKNNRKTSSYMLMTDSDGMPYYSHSGNSGEKWSYPKALSPVMRGSDHILSIYKGYAVVVFRCITSDGKGKHNDILLWHGSMQQYTDGIKEGDLMTIIDNSPDEDAPKLSVEDVALLKKKHFFVLLKENQNDETDTLHLLLFKLTKQ